jgi:hypothetical protein
MNVQRILDPPGGYLVTGSSVKNILPCQARNPHPGIHRYYLGVCY